VNRGRVALVEPGDDVAPELVSTASSPVFRREEVTLILADGEEIGGRIAMDLPDEFSRVSDFLNFPQSFFALERPEGTVIVAKEHVSGIVPHEKPPVLPAGSDVPAEESA
jgi:hypothetical protein